MLGAFRVEVVAVGAGGSVVVEEGSRKVAGSNPDEANFLVYVILPPLLGREMSTRRRNNFLGNRARPVHRADNLTATCEPIV
jgi:hypothetical protein